MRASASAESTRCGLGRERRLRLARAPVVRRARLRQARLEGGERAIGRSLEPRRPLRFGLRQRRERCAVRLLEPLLGERDPRGGLLESLGHPGGARLERRADRRRLAGDRLGHARGDRLRAGLGARPQRGHRVLFPLGARARLGVEPDAERIDVQADRAARARDDRVRVAAIARLPIDVATELATADAVAFVAA